MPASAGTIELILPAAPVLSGVSVTIGLAEVTPEPADADLLGVPVAETVPE